MGITGLWSELADRHCFDDRVSLKNFAAKFWEENGRPVRLAIDAYIWLIESASGLGNNGQNAPNSNIILQGFHSRIRELISLNISFVFVFDGPFKPPFKRNFQGVDVSYSSDDFDLDYQTVKTRPLDRYVEVPAFRPVFELLDCWNIKYVIASGEAEAECCRLETSGVVDYVVSNDSDVLCFGARRILRNYSKNVHDSANNEPGQKEIFVTPVHLDKVEQLVGLDRFGFILFVVLCGGDYSGGVAGLGAVKSFKIASSFNPTHKKADSDYMKPDFSRMLRDIYIVDEDDYIRGRLPDYQTRQKRYSELQDSIKAEVSNYSLQLFGRNEKLTLCRFPSDYIVMLYFYPLLVNTLFMFTPGTTNYVELMGDYTMKAGIIPQPSAIIPTSERSKQSVVRSDGDRKFGGTFNIDTFDFDFNNEDRVVKSSIPIDWLRNPNFANMLNLCENYKFPSVDTMSVFLLRVLTEAYVVRFIMICGDGEDYKDSLFIDDQKDKLIAMDESSGIQENLEQFKVKYSSNLLKKLINIELDFEIEEKFYSILIPKSSMEHICPQMIERYTKFSKEKLLKKSLKLKPKKSSQKTTLDSLFFGSRKSKNNDSSKINDETPFREVITISTETSCQASQESVKEIVPRNSSKKSMPRAKKNPRTRGKILPPNQKTISSFFQIARKDKEANAIQEAGNQERLFVDTDESDFEVEIQDEDINLIFENTSVYSPTKNTKEHIRSNSNNPMDMATAGHTGMARSEILEKSGASLQSPVKIKSKVDFSPSRNILDYSNMSLDLSPSKIHKSDQINPIESPTKKTKRSSLTSLKSNDEEDAYIGTTSTPFSSSTNLGSPGISLKQSRRVLKFGEAELARVSEDENSILEIHEDTFVNNVAKKNTTSKPNIADILDTLMAPIQFSSDESD